MYFSIKEDFDTLVFINHANLGNYLSSLGFGFLIFKKKREEGG